MLLRAHVHVCDLSCWQSTRLLAVYEITALAHAGLLALGAALGVVVGATWDGVGLFAARHCKQLLQLGDEVCHQPWPLESPALAP